jgi:hypothetical protein
LQNIFILVTRRFRPDYIERNRRAITGSAIHAKQRTARYLSRTGDARPSVVAIATLPVVLGDGRLLALRGLDRGLGIAFRVPEELLSLLPTCDQCDDAAVRKAFKLLHDEWLVDVATDFTGKCILIATAPTLIERSLLPDRPAFFVTAGRRGGRKTTTLVMWLIAITGVRPSAAAWCLRLSNIRTRFRLTARNSSRSARTSSRNGAA